MTFHVRDIVSSLERKFW